MKSTPPKRNKPSFLKRSARLLLLVTITAVIVCAAIAYRLFFSDLFLDSTIVTVPSLVGKTYDRDALPNAELYRIVRIEEYNEALPGTVLKQFPSEGSERKAVAGKHYVTLTLYVSKGEETNTVPALVGESAQTGKVRLQERGFDAKIVKAYSTHPEGKIIAQAPDAGTVLKTGETVTLKISRGTSVKTAEVPNVTGLSQVRAQSLIQAHGLKTGSVRYRETGGEEGIVLAQSPRAAERASRGSAVDLIVSRRPAETTAPPESAPDESAEMPIETEKATEQSTKSEESDRGNASPEGLIDRILEKYLPELR